MILVPNSKPFACVCIAGTKFGTYQTSTDLYELGLSYLSVSIFIVIDRLKADVYRFLKKEKCDRKLDLCEMQIDWS